MIDLTYAAGKYGAYIWPAYGVSAAAFLTLIVDTWLRARRWRRDAERGRESAAPRGREGER